MIGDRRKFASARQKFLDSLNSDQQNQQLSDIQETSTPRSHEDVGNTCVSCGITFSGSESYWKHLVILHGVTSNGKNLQCPSCNSRFDRADCLRRHFKSCCRSSLHPSSTSSSSFCASESDGSDFIASTVNVPSIEMASCGEVVCHTGSEIIRKLFNELLSLLLRNRRIPYEMTAAICKIVSKLGLEICEQFISSSRSVEETKNLIISVTENLSTPFKIKKYVFENFTIKPQEVVVDSIVAVQNINESGQSIQGRKFLNYFQVPIRPFFSSLVLNEEFMSACKLHVISKQFTPENILTDIRDSGKKITEDDDLIFTVNYLLYSDEIEVCNPLGSKAGKQKLFVTYLIVKDLPSRLTSKLQHIHFISAIKSVYVKEYGINAVFRSLVQQLEDAYKNPFVTDPNRTNETVRFRLVGIIGDNLGQHQLLGFNESFSSNFPCRFCKMNRETCQKALTADPLVRRTRLTHEQDVLLGNPSATGLKFDSVFNELSYFHTAESVTVDLMHDILEGVAVYDLACIFSHFFETKVLTVAVLNLRLQSFNYSRTFSKCKPPQFKTNLLPNMSAPQMYCFIQILPLLIADLVSSDSRHRSLLLLLRNIIDRVMAPSISTSGVSYLRNLVADHNELYLEISGELLKPKFHHLLHYPDFILDMGPVVQYSAMRPEAKHREIKHITNNNCNMINISKSVAEKMQLAALSHVGIPSYGDEFYFDPEYTVEYSESGLIAGDYSFQEDESVSVGSKAWFNDVEYRVGDVMLLRWVDLPVFGKVLTILQQNSRWFFQLQLLNTKYFDSHMHAYVADEDDTIEYANVIDLAHYKPLYYNSCMPKSEGSYVIITPVTNV